MFKNGVHLQNKHLDYGKWWSTTSFCGYHIFRAICTLGSHALGTQEDVAQHRTGFGAGAGPGSGGHCEPELRGDQRLGATVGSQISTWWDGKSCHREDLKTWKNTGCGRLLSASDLMMLKLNEIDEVVAKTRIFGARTGVPKIPGSYCCKGNSLYYIW